MAGSDIILGLDVGTTAAKASAFSLDGGVRVTGQHGYPLDNPHPGWHTQDPQAIASAVLAALRDTLDGLDPGRVLGISISTAMHGLVGRSSRASSTGRW